MPQDPTASPPPLAPLPVRLLLFGVVLFLLDPTCTTLASIPLQSLGFYAWYYGPDAVEQAPVADRVVLVTRMALWASVLGFPLWLLGTAVFVRGLKIVTFAEVGLALRNCGRNAAWGVAAAVLVCPLVLALNWGVVALSQSALHVEAKEHPLAQAGEKGLFPAEWLLLACAVSVAAPLREELLFRGILQRVFGERSWGAHFGMGLALLFALGSTANTFLSYRWSTANTQTPQLLSASMPVLFVLALLPVYVAVWWWSKLPAPAPSATYPDLEPEDIPPAPTSQAPTVFATALLFGAVHSFAWPTPIALFVLGLALGYLALRTRSLVAPIVLHSLFNGVSFVLLLVGWGS